LFDRPKHTVGCSASGRRRRRRIRRRRRRRRRRKGRTRKRWKEEVERDLQVLGVRRWRELVADRKKMVIHFSTGQSPQWAVVPMEEEEEGGGGEGGGGGGGGEKEERGKDGERK